MGTNEKEIRYIFNNQGNNSLVYDNYIIPYCRPNKDGSINYKRHHNNNYVSIRSSISNIAISSSQTNVFNDDTSSYHSNFAGVGYVNEDTASSYATASNYNYYYENSNDYNNYVLFLIFVCDFSIENWIFIIC